MINSLKNFAICDDETKASVIVINSCTVTNSADSGVRNYINQIKRKNPNAKIYFTGCGVTTQGEALFEEKELTGVFGHSEKEKIEELLASNDRFFTVGDLSHIDNTIVTEFIGKSRAFIKIQEGCDFECSYCIIPSVRGNARSIDEETILKQIEILAYNGFSEFILTGTNVGSYGKDKGSSIAKLLKKISLIKNVKRIRVGSLEPVQIDDEFFEILNEKWMAKHLHIALQHAHDDILESMKRRNKFKDDLKLFEKIASHGYALGTDFIVGFPNESDAVWKETLKRVALLPLTHIHAFTYSKRDNTPASVMTNQVKGDIAKARHKELTNLIKEKNILFRKSNKVPLEVLIESDLSGFDQFFNKMQIVSKNELEGNWITLSEYEIKDEKNIAHL
ncbi:MAG: threonylcarbamoyladenosine tRNA methylthiotransferase MtaB [Campylobacterota bacterium]|nr:threonylcarbamoyladenosine tRNA methylthiotransferase MtaB [Campylobacterota bacterium]